MPAVSNDPVKNLLITPEDTNAAKRTVRLRELGLGTAPVPEFDEFARNLALSSSAPYAMINFIDDTQQYFAGLYTPSAEHGLELNPALASAPQPGRKMPRDHGYCPHVIVRRKALVLEDVCDYPRFAGNPVVDEIGIRSYMGAPLIDRTGMAVGTVCVLDQEPRPWGRQGLALIKSMAADLVERIHRFEA